MLSLFFARLTHRSQKTNAASLRKLVEKACVDKGGPSTDGKTIGLIRVSVYLSCVLTHPFAFPSNAAAEALSVAQFETIARECAPTVASATLAALARTESQFQTLAINDNTAKETYVPDALDQAVETASRRIVSNHSVDLGIMQINSRNFRKLGMSVTSAFDPCVSIAAAGALLQESYIGGATPEEQQISLRRALSKYNTGNAERGFRNGYVHKVELSARALVPALDVGAGGPPAVRPNPLAASSNTLAAPQAWNVWASYESDANLSFGRPTAVATGTDATVASGTAEAPPTWQLF